MDPQIEVSLNNLPQLCLFTSAQVCLVSLVRFRNIFVDLFSD
jgi:hypothetical protein